MSTAAVSCSSTTLKLAGVRLGVVVTMQAGPWMGVSVWVPVHGWFGGVWLWHGVGWIFCFGLMFGGCINGVINDKFSKMDNDKTLFQFWSLWIWLFLRKDDSAYFCVFEILIAALFFPNITFKLFFGYDQFSGLMSAILQPSFLFPKYLEKIFDWRF